MRNRIISNLLLIMFLVGAASGFFVSNAGWWGLYQGEQDLERVRVQLLPYEQVAEAQKAVIHSQSLLLDAIRKQRLSNADKNVLARDRVKLHNFFGMMRAADTAQRDAWDQAARLYEHLAASQHQTLEFILVDDNQAYRHYTRITQPLANKLLATLNRMLPAIAETGSQVHTQALASNRMARNLLLGLSALATVFFCLTAGLTYRESMERRRKSNALDQEHTMFRTLFQGSNDGVILLRAGNVSDLNRAALAQFAVPASRPATQIQLNDLLPAKQADGRPSAAAFLEKLASAQNGKVQCFEWRFLAFDGREFPAEVNIDVARVSNNSIVQLTIRDITRRKEAENSMRLANQAFENSLEGIAITDADRNILTVNSMFTTITGYEADEVIGRNPSLLSSGRQTPEFYQEMWASLSEQGKWEGEVWNIRKNGDIYPQWLSISRVSDEHGNVTNYVGVFSDITERKSAEDRILHQVYYDQLTDLPNRVLFNDRLSQVLGMARRHDDQAFAVMFLDLDRFKLINDTMGHQAGDQLLQQAAHRLRGSVRESDTVARMSGDEFTVLLSEIANPKHAANVAQKILDTFHQPFLLDGEEIYVSVSIGISVYPQDGRTSEVLIKNADMAMYRAKGAGGSWYELYDECLGTLANERLSMETALHKAIERDELELHYQPQFDCDSGRLAGFEALLRWRHPERGLLLPEAFLSIAEESGLTVAIGDWVLQTACIQAQTWRREFPGHRLMAVNLSPRHFHSPDLARQVSNALRRSGLPHFCLELEVTESAVTKNFDASVSIMQKLTELGVQFSVDDFGTGHSSLTLLKKLPIHALKVDQSFIRDLDIDEDDASIVSAIVAMANRLGLRVVAEGVEQQAQLDILKTYKGVMGQGYLLGRPLAAPAAAHLMADGRLKLAAA